MSLVVTFNESLTILAVEFELLLNILAVELLFFLRSYSNLHLGTLVTKLEALDLISTGSTVLSFGTIILETASIVNSVYLEFYFGSIFSTI